MIITSRNHDRLFGLIIVAIILGIGHHTDHVIRGNHVGWPLIPIVTPFTYSLLIYVPILAGLYLYRKRKVGSAYWSVVAGFGAVFVGLTHFGPLPAEPPQDIIDSYASPVAGWFAFGWLVTFLTVLLSLTVYTAYLWVRERSVPS